MNERSRLLVNIFIIFIGNGARDASAWPAALTLWPSSRLEHHDNNNNLVKWTNHGTPGEPRVLNFFPVPVEEECLSEDKRRRGICMNTYECRIQQGKSHGPCALGFGVCCIFTTSCGGEVLNNLTYVTSPGFPNLIDQPMNCTIAVRRIEPQVSQLRIEFVHFNIGQPNRRTGLCDEDVMEVTSGGDNSLQLCGWNSGQHIYVDVADDGAVVEFRLPSELQSRMWEMRVVQLPFEQRAPAGCLQYFDSPRGTLKTLNYLPNGRYLANQDYLLCVRQERGMCSISYSPCSGDSFKIGPSRFSPFNSNNNSNNNVTNPSANRPASNTTTSGVASSDSSADVAEGSGTEDTSMTPSGTTTNPRCPDRVLIPCDFEEFITPGNDGAGICDLEHCGSSLCSPSEMDADGNCRVETSATPFHIRVAFGPGEDESGGGVGGSAEDKAGMCLTYEQLPCVP